MSELEEMVRVLREAREPLDLAWTERLPDGGRRRVVISVSIEHPPKGLVGLCWRLVRGMA